MTTTVKIAYVPENGMRTNYRDCRALAPDGSVWDATGGRWANVSRMTKPVSRAQRAPTKRRSFRGEKAEGSPAGAALGFAAGMALFAKPAFMSFAPPVALLVLFAICCVSAVIFHWVSRT